VRPTLLCETEGDITRSTKLATDSSPRSETLYMHGHFSHGNWEVLLTPVKHYRPVEEGDNPQSQRVRW